jgi:hypothetical protein
MNQENDKNDIDLSKFFEKNISNYSNSKRFSDSYISPAAPKIFHLLIKYSGGLIKNEKQAYYFLLVFIILMFFISFLLIFGNSLNIKIYNSTMPSVEEAGSPREIVPY